MLTVIWMRYWRDWMFLAQESRVLERLDAGSGKF